MRLPSIRPAARRRARAHVACALLAAAALAGCSAAPPLRWVQLPLDPSAPRLAPGLPAPASEAARSGAGPIHLLPVRLPEVLDRDELLVPQGPAGLAPLSGWRWAEPLREAVPRLLRDDLARALGESRVWTSPLPAGLGRVQPLRVEVVMMQAEPSATDPEYAAVRERLLARAAAFDGPVMLGHGDQHTYVLTPDYGGVAGLTRLQVPGEQAAVDRWLRVTVRCGDEAGFDVETVVVGG